MSLISTSEFVKGNFIEFKGQPHQIVEFQHVNPGKGSAFIRTKLKSLKTGKVQEFTYKSGETVKEYPVNVQEMQYLYKQADSLIFMNRSTYEQITVPRNVIGNFADFLKDGDIYQILIHENEACGMRYPKKVRLKVMETDVGVRGNTVSGAKKVAVVETGVSVQVPLFIKVGDIIALDPETGLYLERSSQS